MRSRSPRSGRLLLALELAGLAGLAGCHSTPPSTSMSTPTPTSTPEAVAIDERGLTLGLLRTLGAEVEPIVVRAADAYGLGVHRPDREAWLAMKDRAGEAQAILGELTPEQWEQVRWLSERRLGRSFLVVGAGLRPAWMVDGSSTEVDPG